jgi:hypothetical protein
MKAQPVMAEVNIHLQARAKAKNLIDQADELVGANQFFSRKPMTAPPLMRGRQYWTLHQTLSAQLGPNPLSYKHRTE